MCTGTGNKTHSCITQSIPPVLAGSWVKPALNRSGATVDRLIHFQNLAWCLGDRGEQLARANFAHIKITIAALAIDTDACIVSTHDFVFSSVNKIGSLTIIARVVWTRLTNDMNNIAPFQSLKIIYWNFVGTFSWFLQLIYLSLAFIQ